MSNIQIGSQISIIAMINDFRQETYNSFINKQSSGETRTSLIKLVETIILSPSRTRFLPDNLCEAIDIR
ncbi:hypothetical protein MJO28_013427 [Puccinia striiformis f. sp. tritici]|uniref:Uncharacterized protein n=1 Tax=Puccinia striiformis f. sp. tritici TaxID=168172 RepID=A0ACC0E175_9BASI|nr:hypothetical protein MJO28_013427 [Puccinia striiformis f. sp. tritici]